MARVRNNATRSKALHRRLFRGNLRELLASPEPVETKRSCDLCTSMHGLRQISIDDTPKLLCHGCHRELSSETVHGTYGGYRGGCDCDACSDAYRCYQRSYRATSE